MDNTQKAAMTDRWDNHFLQLALDHARMSKDPSTAVGAVIVGPDREIRSMGFNGLPRGIADTMDRLTDRDMKLRLVVHAEMNAVLAAARIGVSVRGCTLYIAATDSTGHIWGGCPCTRCTVEMIQSGIGSVVSRPGKAASRWADDIAFARTILDEAGIPFREIPVPAMLATRAAPAGYVVVPEAREAFEQKAMEEINNADGCFEAALAEGWIDAVANGDVEAIRDLYYRRIAFARGHLSSAHAAISAAMLAARPPLPGAGGPTGELVGCATPTCENVATFGDDDGEPRCESCIQGIIEEAAERETLPGAGGGE